MRASRFGFGVRRAAITFGLAISAVLLSSGGRARADDEPPAEPPPPAMDDAPAGTDPDEEDAPPSLVERIDTAIKKGVAYLLAHTKGDGSWGDLHTDAKTYNGTTDGYDDPAGPTALALYTLLKCGIPVSDPVVKRGFEWLKKRYRIPGEAYEISMALLAVTATADPFKRTKDSTAAGDKVKITGEWRKWATDLKDALLKLRAPIGWRYWGPKDTNAGGTQDLSSTQLAALALLAAERCGISVDPSVWTGIIEFSRAQQETEGPEHPRAVLPKAPPKQPAAGPAGPGETGEARKPPGSEARPMDSARGFAYIRDKAKDPDDRLATGAMTACGVGNLMMARYVLSNRFPNVWKKVEPNGIQRCVYDGLAWLDRNWDPIRNPPKDTRTSYHLYYLYCVERTMDLVGGWRLGAHAWYVEMTEKLLPLQKPAGFWDTQSTIANGPVLDTCFALLFLHRATRGGIPFPSVTGGSDTPATDGR